MAFEWDSNKNAANMAKHGIDFEDAIRIFEGPVLESADEHHQHGEDRIVAFGVRCRGPRTGGRLHHARRSSPDNIGKESTPL